MFSKRHSSNKREAAAHLQRWTSEKYMSSAQLWRGDVHWRGHHLRDLSTYLFNSHQYQHSFQQQEELQPGLKLEDEEENCVSLVTVLQIKTL